MSLPLCCKRCGNIYLSAAKGAETFSFAAGTGKIMIMLENLHITKSVTFLDKGVVCITIDLIGIRLLMSFATVM